MLVCAILSPCSVLTCGRNEAEPEPPRRILFVILVAFVRGAEGPEVGREIGGYVLPFSMEVAPAAPGGGSARNKGTPSHAEERVLVVGQVSHP